MFRRIFTKTPVANAVANNISPLKRNITTIARAEPVLPKFDPDQMLEEVKKYAEAHPDDNVKLPPHLKSKPLTPVSPEYTHWGRVMRMVRAEKKDD